MSSQVTKSQALYKLWERGILHWKLDSTQKELYDFYLKNPNKVTTFLCSRRLGKSYALCVIALETCIKNKNAVVKYLCPTQRMVRTIITPIMRQLLEDCPSKFTPKYSPKDGVYIFPNGSEIQMAGNDSGNSEKLRGGSSHLCIVDEAGFCDDLSYSINSVLLPTTLTTNGKVIISSTPSKNSGHEFMEIVRNADVNDSLIKKTIFDNPRLSPVQIDDIIKSYQNGMQNPDFRREYLCETTYSDSDSTIIPEFDEETEKAIVTNWLRPTHFDYYVAADFGFKDLTAVLFGYLDFKNNKFIIEDEIIVKGCTTEHLANLIKEKEKILLFNNLTKEQKQPHLRVSDVNWFIINDLHKLHDLKFLPTQKDDLEAAINNARILIGGRKVIINPKCKTLIKHIKNGVWSKSELKRKFARSSDDGHFDALAALIYMLRNINWNRSPFPKGYEYRHMSNPFIVREKTNTSDLANNLQKQFKVKKSL